jgi:phenylpyruvate tautomerase PptA (4-oxalocrotonate tautomerase family)
MPLVRIDISKDASQGLVRIIGDAVYDAMTVFAHVPVNDRFQIVTRHERDELIYPADGYLGIEYSAGIVFIQVTWVGGRSIEVKKAFYKSVAGAIAEKGGLRQQDVFISLVDSGREDWSFGNGEMQYAPV